MELRFVQPDLRRIDLLAGEMLAMPVATDERPPRGTAGLVDYRLAGRISEALESGALRGQMGEKVFFRGRPKLPFDKVLVYGQGDLTSFNPHLFAGIVDHLLATFQDLGVRRAVVELPGRARELISPEVAAEILLDRAAGRPLFDTWTLVDTSHAQRSVTQALQRDRRNDWKVGP